VHGVGHESEGGQLVGELFAEEEEICVGGVDGLEEFEGEIGGDPFCADGGIDFCAEGGVVRWVWGVLGIRTEFVHCEEDGVIFIDAVAAAMVLVYPLEGDVGCVILNDSKLWREWYHERQEEVQVASSTLLSLRQCAVEDTEELQDSLFSSTVSRSWILNGEWMHATIMASDLQASMREANSPHKVDIGQKPLNSDEVAVLVTVLQILPGHLDIIEFRELELAESVTELLQIPNLRPTIKLLLKFVPPLS